MCSALGQESKVLEAIKAGAKDFVVKPFQPDRVLDAIGKALLGRNQATPVRASIARTVRRLPSGAPTAPDPVRCDAKDVHLQSRARPRAPRAGRAAGPGAARPRAGAPGPPRVGPARTQPAASTPPRARARPRHGSTESPATSCQAREAYVERTEREQDAARQELAASAQQVEFSRGRLVEAGRDREVLERLKRRRAVGARPRGRPRARSSRSPRSRSPRHLRNREEAA